MTGLFTILSGSVSYGIGIPEPTVLPESLVTLSVPDLHKTLDAAQILVDQILPDDKKVDLKAQLGGFIGDPDLAGIPVGGGAAVVWNGTTSYAVLECNPETAEKLMQMSGGMQLQAAVLDGSVVFSKNQTGLDAGKKQAAEAVKTLLNQERTGVVVNLRCADLVTKFRPQINMMTLMMPNMMAQNSAKLPAGQAKSMQGMAKFMEGELRVLVSLASQVDSLEVAVIPGKDAVEIRQTFAMRDGSNLYQLVTAPAVLQPDPQISTSLLQPGMMRLEMFLGNPEALQIFLKAESDQLAKEMSLDPALTEKWDEMMNLWPMFFSGSIAETISMDPEQGFAVGFVSSMQEPEHFLKFLESLPEVMKSFMQMYEDLGMPMSMDLTLHSRSYRDADIHQYNFKYDVDKMDPLVAEQIKSMNMAEMNSELTLVDHRLLWTMGAFPLNTLIDNLKNGTGSGNPVLARQHFPADGFCYYDFDIGQYLSLMVNMMPKDDSPVSSTLTGMYTTLANKLKDSPPITGAAFQQENRISTRLILPVEIMHQFALFSTTIPGASPSNPSATLPVPAP